MTGNTLRDPIYGTGLGFIFSCFILFSEEDWVNFSFFVFCRRFNCIEFCLYLNM